MLLGWTSPSSSASPSIQAGGAGPASISFGWWRTCRRVRAALQVNVLFLIGHRRGGGALVDVPRNEGGPCHPGRGRQHRTPPCHGAEPALDPHAGHGGRGLCRCWRRVSVRSSIPEAGRGSPRARPDGGGAGDLRALEPDLLASGGDPLRRPRARFGPALQSVASAPDYYFFYAAPYVLTLGVLIATSSPTRAMTGAPWRAGITK